MIDDDDPYRVVETAALAEVTSVRIYTSSIEHVATEHPEFPLLPCVETAVDSTITDPHLILKSNPPHVGSFKYVSYENTFEGNAMVVAVKLIEGSSALFKTAYFPDEVTGTVVWSKDGE